MSKKLYLSKSNLANPVDYKRAKEALSRFNVQVLEFGGGSYGPKDEQVLLSADYLLLVPPVNQSGTKDYEFHVGRGQYEQVKKFTQGFKYWENRVFVLESSDGNDIDMLELDDVRSLETNYTDRWATMMNFDFKRKVFLSGSNPVDTDEYFYTLSDIINAKKPIAYMAGDTDIDDLLSGLDMSKPVTVDKKLLDNLIPSNTVKITGGDIMFGKQAEYSLKISSGIAQYTTKPMLAASLFI